MSVTQVKGFRWDVAEQLEGRRVSTTAITFTVYSQSPEEELSYFMRLSVCRNLLLGEIDREERERCWYFSQLEALSQKLAHLPRIDTVRTHARTQALVFF